MSIQKRTVFYDDSTGVVRWSDWAVVTTTLGVMVEPFSMNERFQRGQDFTNFDPTDEISRIDEIRRISMHKEKRILSGTPSGDDGPYLHGGTHNPRIGV